MNMPKQKKILKQDFMMKLYMHITALINEYPFIGIMQSCL